MGKDREAIWGHVEDLGDGRWKCKFCGEEYSGNASRIKAHLGKVGRQGIKGCKKVDEATKKEAESALASSRDSRSVGCTSDRVSESSFHSKRKRSEYSQPCGGDVARTSSNNVGEMGTGSGAMCNPSIRPSNFEVYEWMDNPFFLDYFDHNINSLLSFGEEEDADPLHLMNVNNNNNSSNPVHDGTDSASSRHYGGTADTASSQLHSGDFMGSCYPNVGCLFSIDNVGASSASLCLGMDGTAMTNPGSSKETQKRDGFMPMGENDEDENSGSDSDISPVDDPLSLADKYCGNRYKRLEVLQILRRGDTLVISGGVEGFTCISSLSPPLAGDVKNLVVDGCPKMKSLIGIGPTTTLRLQNLKEIVVKNCAEFQEIAATVRGRNLSVLFLSLESIKISECPRMRVLMGPMSLPLLKRLSAIQVHNCNRLETVLASSRNLLVPLLEGLIRLRSLEIVGCPNIQRLISSKLLYALCNIQNITVADCERMEEIIGQDGREQRESNAATSKSPLSQLRNLTLKNLPELNSISEGAVGCNDLKLVDISRCPKLNRIPLLEGLVSPLPSLKIKIDKNLWKSLEWRDHDAKTRFQQFLTLRE